LALRLEEIRARLCARLRERGAEIEAAVIARVQGIADDQEIVDPEYTQGLREATAAALEYGIAALERRDEDPPPVPEELRQQARLAARNRVSLETVLRRYFAGYALLGDFTIGEWERSGVSGDALLKNLLRTQSAIFDRLVVAVGGEYARETEWLSQSSEQRLVERVERLLSGELLDTSKLTYDFGCSHLAAVVSGPAAPGFFRDLAGELDRLLLYVRPHREITWAWWGGRDPLSPAQITQIIDADWPDGTALSLGEPGEGLAGWRLTHRQARAALPVARSSASKTVRYREVGLLASILRDDLLVASLRELYLEPLASERDGGAALRETLRVYFAHERNITSTAATLKVTRRTVRRRLHTVEQLLGTALSARAVEIEAALRLDEISRASVLA
jgi:hypothetical protein